MQSSIVVAMLLGAASAFHHEVPASYSYFAVGQSDEETNDMPIHPESHQAHEAYLNDTDIANTADVQLKYNQDAGLWQYELLQLDEEPVAAAEKKTADAKASAGYDMKLSEYGPTEKVQSLNPIAYQYWSDTNKTGAFRRARTTFY